MCRNSEQSSVLTRNFERVCEILEEFSYDKTKLIPILAAVQDEYRYLPEEIMTFIASSLDISPSRVYGVATFYSHFALEPKGKYVIKVCDGTACHVKNSTAIIEAIQRKLSLDNKKNTTEDMMFTLEAVSCLGACGLAPVVVVNEEVFSLMDGKKTEKVIDKIMKKETANEPA